jgi:hypothetical protein
MPTLHQGVYVGSSATILHGTTTSIQGLASCNNAEAKKKVIDFIEQQNAAEQAARIAAATASSFNIINCAWVKIGACQFHSVFEWPQFHLLPGEWLQ